MSVTLERLREIAGEVAPAVDGRLDVAGVRSVTDGEYAEILLSLDGCEIEPCFVMVGVFRDMPPEALRTAIADALREHLSRRRNKGSDRG